MPLLWQAKSLKDFTRFEQKRPEQSQDLGNGIFRAEVKFGDVVPGYSDARSLWDISQLAFREGDECSFAIGMQLGADWIGWFPKNDELGNWPGTPNVGAGQGGIAGGSFLEFHHAPNDGDWSKLWPPSAPFYFGANADNWRAYLLETDPNSPNFGGPRAAGTWLKPLVRGQTVEFVIHVLWSVDPAKGYIEIDADGAPWVPKFRSATLYPNTFVYPQIGLYRRGFIGDPTLTWFGQARPGIVYPPQFVPHMGARVFPDPGGYLQSVQFRNPRIGVTKEDVMATATPAPATGTTTTTVAPSAPEWLWKDVQDGLNAQVTAADAEVTAATQRRDALARVRDTLVTNLRKGPGWLGP